MLDAVIVRNPTLRAAVLAHRPAQLAFLLDAKRELEASAGLDLKPARWSSRPCKYGRLNSPHAIAIDPAGNAFVGALMSLFERALPAYDVQNFELFLGNEVGTTPHNDAYLYLGTGQAVGLQFWLLLEACPLSDPSRELERDKNALECLVPVAPGVLWPGMEQVLTPRGAVAYREERIVGGDDVRLGDLVVFKNGVVHRSAGKGDVLRAALAFRAVLKDEADSDDVELMLWFRDACRSDPALKETLDRRGNPYYRKARARWNVLPERPADPTRLEKIDRNDHLALHRRLAEFDFSC